MKRSMVSFLLVFLMGGMALAFGPFLAPSFGQGVEGSSVNGKRIFIPESSIPRPGRINTNYFIVGSDYPAPQPPPDAETPASLACVYELVSGPAGCPISTSTNVPTGGVGAIAIVDAGDYPTAAADLHAFSSYFGLPDANLQIVYANGTKPPVYPDWEVEEALDIEWAHAMAPNAKLFLVESIQVNTDPTWQAVRVAGKTVAENGGGVISMSWGIPEWPQEVNFDKNFTHPGVVYFAAAGDSGLNYPFHPAASPNVVSVGGTYFNRDGNGNFLNEQYYTGGGGGAISPYEPRPSYQDVIQSIVGTHRGFPDVASDFCCAAIYLQGWGEVGGTSWSSPTMAGIVNAAGLLKKSTHDELTKIYNEYGSGRWGGLYRTRAPFYDITTGDPSCVVGWDLCAGVGAPRTYKGK
jgi:subtilase family serine protease